MIFQFIFLILVLFQGFFDSCAEGFVGCAVGSLVLGVAVADYFTAAAAGEIEAFEDVVLARAAEVAAIYEGAFGNVEFEWNGLGVVVDHFLLFRRKQIG